MAKTVVALYERFEDAQHAVAALQDGGFRRTDISIIANDKAGELTRDIGDLRRDMNVERVVEHRDNDQAENVGQGAGVGAVLGGAIGLLAGIGAFAIPGLGPVLVAGPLLSILTGAGIGAATGGLIGALTSAGLSDAEAREYYAGVERGGTLVAVKVPEGQASLAEEILSRHSPFSVRQPADVRDTSLPETAAHTQPQVGDDAYSTEHLSEEREREDVDLRTTSEDILATSNTNVLTGREFPDPEREVEEEAKDEVVSRAGGAAPGMTWDAGRLDLGVAEAERQPRGGMGSDVDPVDLGVGREPPASQQPESDATGTGVPLAHQTHGTGASVFNGPLSASGSAGLQYSGTEADEFNRFDADFRRHYEHHYVNSAYGYEVYQQAYRYGYGLDMNEQYRGRNWDEIEPNVRQAWERSHPENTWEDFKDAVREGWERMRGKR